MQGTQNNNVEGEPMRGEIVPAGGLVSMAW